MGLLTISRVSSLQTVEAPPRPGTYRRLCRSHKCVKDGTDLGSTGHRPAGSIASTSDRHGGWYVMHDWSDMLDNNGRRVGGDGPMRPGHTHSRLSQARQDALIQAMW